MTFVYVTLLVWLAAGAGRAAEQMELTHTVYLGGIYMGKIETLVDQTDDAYRVESRAATSEAMKWVLRWIAVGETEGRISTDGLRPEMHVHSSAWQGKKRSARLDYDRHGNVTFETAGRKSNNPAKYIPIDPGSLQGSVDPLSMILWAARKLDRDRECSGTYPVFDGRRRFDVILSQSSSRTFPPSRYSVFKGTAIGCRIEIKGKGGFKRDGGDSLASDSDVVIYAAAPVPGGHMVPVRMELPTELGVMTLHLERYADGTFLLASQTAN
jgi:hypothetical protein